MIRILRVQDLPMHPKAGVQLKCWHCHGEYSAHRGDYFLSSPDEPMLCCEEPLALVQKRTVYEEVA